MRELNSAEIERTAGGNEPERRLPTVTVPGKKIDPYRFGVSLGQASNLSNPFIYTDFGPEPDSIGTESGGCPANYDQTQFPDGVDPNAMRSLAGELADQLSALRAAAIEEFGNGTEHGAFILKLPSGQLISSEIFNSNNSDSIEFDDWNRALEPFKNGIELGVIDLVGWIHVQSSSLPSGQGSSATGGEGDWGVVDRLVQAGADADMVTYIVDANGNLYEYTRDKEGTNIANPVPPVCTSGL